MELNREEKGSTWISYAGECRGCSWEIWCPVCLGIYVCCDASNKPAAFCYQGNKGNSPDELQIRSCDIWCLVLRGSEIYLDPFLSGLQL